jgi:crossover junction endodeoxyribonuclease RuvC
MTAPTTAAPATGAAAPPRVAGVDLSLTSTGIAYNTGHCLKVGRSDVTTLPLDQRTEVLRELADTILSHIDTADLVLIEKFVLARGKAGAGGAGERAHLYYLVVDALIHQIHTPVVEVPQGTLKIYATGRGNAPKDEVKDAVAKRLPMYVTKGNSDMCDAAVLAAMGSDHLGHPLVVMPQAHRAALAKVAWPQAATP